MILGYRFMSMIFIVLISLGQFIIYLGCSRNDMQMMILGRFIYGLGGESIGITSSVFVVVWFSGKELSFTNVPNESLNW
jgi:MFS family permease